MMGEEIEGGREGGMEIYEGGGMAGREIDGGGGMTSGNIDGGGGGGGMGRGSMMEEEDANGIEYITLPIIDLRSFAQDEIRLLAQLSGDFPEASFKDVVVPKLDRESFNESAGSRKQTYSNRRISKRGLRETASESPAAELFNAGVTSTVRSLWSAANDGPNERLLSSGVATSSKSVKAVGRVIAKAKGTGEIDAARQIVWKREAWDGAALRGTGDGETDLAGDDVGNSSEDGNAGNARKFKRARGVGSGGAIGESSAGATARKKRRHGLENIQEIGTRKTKRSNDEDSDEEEGLVKSKRGRLRSEDGIGEDASFALGSLEAMHRSEDVRKRGTGHLVDRLHNMKGEWSSSDKIRKIIVAAGFPVGWTVHIGLTYKNGRTLFEYGDWRSPEGKLWPSFKEATAYLLSSIENVTSSENVPHLKASGGGNDCDRNLPDEALCSCGENLTRISSLVAEMHPPEVICQRPSEALDGTDGGNGNVYGLSDCCQQVSGVHVDQFSAVNSILDDMPGPGTAEEETGFADPSQVEEDHRTVLNTTETLLNRLSAYKLCCRTTIKGLIEKHCGQQLTKPDQASPRNDIRKFEKNLNRDTGTCGTECREEPFHAIVSNVVCCNPLKAIDAPKHECSVCGMMFSTLLKLHWHLDKAKHSRYFNCEVCGRHFSSITLLFGHRLKMGHPRVTKVTRNSSSLRARGSVPVACSSGSGVSFVLGLLSDPREGQWIGRSPKNPKELRGTPNRIEEEVKQDSFECNICHKVFFLKSKYLGHLNIHSKPKKKDLTICTPSKPVSEQFCSGGVDPKSNILKLGSKSVGVETGGGLTPCTVPPVAKSVFWKLLNDP